MYTYTSKMMALAIAFLFTLNLAGQDCDHPDYAVLEKLYLTTGGGTWNQQQGWLTDCEPCSWFGVNCDSENRVSSIILRGNALVGALPEEIGDLDHLRLLNLGYNKIGADLPASLFTIDSLRDINLSGNRITGSLPVTVGDQLLLENLRLDNNLMEGDLPGELASYTRMTILTLNDNAFTGSVPEGFGDLPFLFNLDLSNNDFSGCFPVDLESLCGQSRMRFGSNPKLSWSGDFAAFCSNSVVDEEQIGAPCDDGDPDTGGDAITADCGCGGTLTPDGLSSGGLIGLENNEEGIQEEVTNNLSAPEAPVLNRVSGISEVSVYPNPVVDGRLNVQLPEDTQEAQLSIVSLIGQLISQTRNSGPTAQLQLPALEAGVYLLEVRTSTGQSVRRVVVQ